MDAESQNKTVLRHINISCKLIQTIKKRKNTYLVHVLRHDRYQLLQLIMMGMFEGKRRTGRRHEVMVTQHKGVDWSPKRKTTISFDHGLG